MNHSKHNMNHSKHNMSNHASNSNPCIDELTDLEYLEHMIPHHQVAIDVSNMLIKITKSPEMHEIIRKLIWTQKYEIELMDELLKTGIFNVTSGKQFRKYQTTISDFMTPNVLQNQRMFWSYLLWWRYKRMF